MTLRLSSLLLSVGTAAVLTLLTWETAAQAAPTISVTPPNGARFLADQRFDLRVEGKPTSGKIIKATLTVDGAPVSFSSEDDFDGFQGYNKRGFSLKTPGIHTLSASLTDASGTATTTANIEIVNAVGRRKPVKNIIILLGDGMGAAHRTAARIVRYGVRAGRPQGFLAMDKFPGSGMVTTSSLSAIVTDSAPGMACYATGNHAQNGQEGVYPAKMANPFHYPRVEYMSEYLHRTQGKSLGLVTTADIEDATPAANAVHTGSRGAGQGICDQYLDEREQNGLTVLMGGGRRWFLPQKDQEGKPVFGSSRSEKNDYGPLPADLTAAWSIPAGTVDPNRNLIGDFTSAGFAYAANRSQLEALTRDRTPARLLGLFAYGNMNNALDKIAKRRNPNAPGVLDDFRDADQPMLDEMATAALRVLNGNPKGFVLMVEGASIDKQSHAMDADRAMGETLEFDRAVQVCRDFAEKDGNTVVIVTADHECSGFSVIGTLGTTPEKLRELASDKGIFDPTKQPERQKIVDQDAFPSYNILPDGYPETYDVPHKLLIGFGSDADRFEGWLTKPRPLADGALPADLKKELLAKGYKSFPAEREESEVGFFIRGQVARGPSADHTAADVPISIFSRDSRVWGQFLGVQENTDVFFKLMRAALGGY